MGGSAAPSPDPRMGEAALLSAQTGQDALAWAQEQAAISNAWAQEDREYYNNTFRPMEEQFVEDANNYDTAARRSEAATAAAADVTQAFDQSQAQLTRANASMGVNPASGRAQQANNRLSTDQALATAGAKNAARLQVERDGEARRAAAINLGQGYAVNPAQSLSMSTGTGMAGFQAGMSGYGQQANILAQQHGAQMNAWQADQQASSGLWGGLGTLAGVGLQQGWFAALSSKDEKTDKRPTNDNLGAVRDMPVERWKYKPEHNDPAEHIGPYAEDFAEATGVGDGKTIDIRDMMGVTLGAIQELDRKVQALEGAA